MARGLKRKLLWFTTKEEVDEYGRQQARKKREPTRQGSGEGDSEGD